MKISKYLRFIAIAFVGPIYIFSIQAGMNLLLHTVTDKSIGTGNRNLWLALSNFGPGYLPD